MKKWIEYLFRFVISLVILWFCFSRIDISKFSLELGEVNPWFFALAFILSVAGSILVPAAITRRAVRVNKLALSLADLVKINFSVRFYTLVFPRGVATGIRWFRYRARGSGDDALALVIFEKVVQIFIMMLTATIFLSMERERLPDGGGWILVGSIILLIGASIGISVFFLESFYRILLTVLESTKRFTPQFIHERMRKLLDAVGALQELGLPGLVMIIGLSLLSYAFFILSAYVLALGMHIDISLRAIAWIRSLVLLIALVPITIAGLGVREAGYISLLQMYGVQSYEALAFSIVLFIIQILIGIIGAAMEAWKHLVLPALRGTKSDNKWPAGKDKESAKN